MSVVEFLLQEARRRERAQTHFYRSLAAHADLVGDRAAAERLNGLLADEQHHLSRITARLLELGSRPDERTEAPGAPLFEGWERQARGRETDEVTWYERVLEVVTDPQTRALFDEILASERHHREELGGKWMSAESTEARKHG